MKNSNVIIIFTLITVVIIPPLHFLCWGWVLSSLYYKIAAPIYNLTAQPGFSVFLFTMFIFHILKIYVVLNPDKKTNEQEKPELEEQLANIYGMAIVAPLFLGLIIHIVSLLV